MTTASPELTQIQEVLSDVAAGVTTKDADRCASWFTADAHSITASGARAVGRDAIRAAHQAAFAGALATTVARFEVLDVLLVRPDVAVVTAGAFPADQDVDLARPATVILHVMVREGGSWSIAARSFTRVTE